MADGSREVVRTAPTAADRNETDRVIVYIDKGLLTTEAEREFVQGIDRMFAATSTYLQRKFDPTFRKTAKPAYYLTNRAGISHAESTRIFLNVRRVIPSRAIVIHESVHLLLMKNPDAPRNRSDLTPEEDGSKRSADLADCQAGQRPLTIAAMLKRTVWLQRSGMCQSRRMQIG